MRNFIYFSKNSNITSLKYFQPLKRESSFSIHNFPIIRVNKFPKVQVTQLVQSPSHLRCPSFPNCQGPSHSKSKSPKAQVTQSPSCPNCQKSKGPPSKKTYCSPMAKIIHGPAIAKNVSRPPMTKTSFPNCQSPSYSKSKSPKAQVTQSSSHPKLIMASLQV